MDLEDAFRELQTNVNADPDHVEEARRRRQMFERAFGMRGLATAATGSLARGSQIEPINDVDLVLIHSRSAHPGWGDPGRSAEEALSETRELIKELLGSQEALEELFGKEAQEMKFVRHTRLQNHAVKCFLDDPGEAGAFTVDVVPALERDPRGFWIPERESQIWIETDPLLLVERVLERHQGYGEGQFVQLLRVLKRWSKDHERVIKGLAIEVLALSHLRDEPRPEALAGFFTAAAAHIFEPIEDPAGLCGEVQPSLDRIAAHELLATASETAAEALAAEDVDGAICAWRELFGDVFPEPEGGCSRAGAGAAAGVGLVIPRGGRRQIKDSPGG